MFTVGQEVKCKETKDMGKIIEIADTTIYVKFTCGLVSFVDSYKTFQLQAV